MTAKILHFPHDAAMCDLCMSVLWPVLVHPSEIIRDEMNARGWDIDHLIGAMGPFADQREPAVTKLAVEMYFYVYEPKMEIGVDLANLFGKAFNVDPQLFLNLHAQWQASMGKAVAQ